MTRRGRIIWFGSAGALVIAGVLGAIFVSGTTGQVLALVLISLGFVLATSLVFFEVGLSEDRERERERRRERERQRKRERERDRRQAETEPRLSRGGRLPRMRGSRRRLR
jgi:UDP-N-acetylmuramyl pentapeptide phosphotransferase/UDP-N-acetylglucosamine-1-phosphate transferase